MGDIGWSYELPIAAYRVLQDWHNQARSWDEGTGIWKDVVEHSPSVFGVQRYARLGVPATSLCRGAATTTGVAAAWSHEAVEFWRRQIELHPDAPGLERYADDAVKAEGEATAWLAKPAAAHGDVAEGTATRP